MFLNSTVSKVNKNTMLIWDAGYADHVFLLVSHQYRKMLNAHDDERVKHNCVSGL